MKSFLTDFLYLFQACLYCIHSRLNLYSKMAYQYPDTVLMIFCKAPVPGQVKTRLTPALTARQAAVVHIDLSIKTVRLATQDNLCPVQLWCAPSTDHLFFSALAARYDVILKTQQGADLGDRMAHAFSSTLATYSRALLIGCDCPSLNSEDLQEALTALHQGHQVLLAPAEDGGYVLIGLDQPYPELFEDIAWGTDCVLEQTRARINLGNLRHYALKTHWDLDTPQDLERYCAITGYQIPA
jgi:rSAM/selenodomain-associated transferase 1